MRVQRRRRHLKKEAKYFLIAMLAICTNTFGTLFFGSIRNELTMKNQSMEREIVVMKKDIEELEVTIRNLTNKDRVFAIAENNGMEISQSNVVAIN